MKVNFILPGLGDSGGIQVVRKYVRLLRAEGIDAVIYCSILAQNLHRYPSGIKNVVHQFYCSAKTVLEIKKKNDVIWVPCIGSRYIRKADHTIATSWATAFEVSKLSSECGKKHYFIQGFEIWDNKELGLESYRLDLNKIVISTWINEQIERELGIGPFPVVYNGIDTETYSPSKTPCLPDTIRLLMMNHENPVKGVKEGLQVIDRIKKKYPCIQVTMFGMNDRANLPDYVEYYQNPSQDLLVNLYQCSDIFLFPSLHDGWGLAPVEAMACGCAVVCARTGFVLDCGKHRENMMVSEPRDIDGMVANTEELINDNELLSYIRFNGINTVKEFDWNTSAKRLVDILATTPC